MRETKESGIEWIGEIPNGWKINCIKHNYYILAGSTPKSEREEYWDGNILWITPADYKTRDKYVEAGRRNISDKGYMSCGTTMIPVGSIIFSKRAPIGTVAINKVELCTNQGCLACVAKSDRVNNEYFYYAISVATEQFELLSSGTTFKEISANGFSNVKLPLPSFETQVTIVNFLNRKCSEIDDLMFNIQTQVDSLGEYKGSVINEAVTMGLNPNVEVIDSGIEWCPAIPNHWSVINPKALFSLRNQRAIQGER